MQIKKYKPKERFSDRVEKYAKYRPSYPRKVIDIFREKYSLKSESVFADIGSGTGIFTQLLLENGYKVYSVEPNQEMRNYAENSLSKFLGYKSINGSAEKTTLEDNSVDAITVAQAFHWFDFDLTINEFQRITKLNGFIFLIWNERKVNENQFHKMYEEILIKYCYAYKEIDHKNFSQERIESIFHGRDIKIYHFENSQLLDLQSLIGRLESSSYCPKVNDENHEPLMKSIRKLFRENQDGGTVEIKYDCVLYGIC